ncbi:sucrase ferredoxin [Streptomyces caniscabiei]|uniref:Sucrase ferredoxin n=1 Tax=Streptomyces caniscabiei TaxID=2746961 RepID=A0A927LBJ1_9ACTN|nr:sucrase ferredoxin [Streptomyces caniscabiei]MBD9728181.1 sucrase ferredoxin [Streptomyces caniscabiei]MDX3513798.1 sucrase ferredoxin [Streptomyces caniscabiei]MDX3722800.1 sucrase ferredoxin [Streptomyces caniscabiei]MDX3731568.1 sucrase ferredoxin [Streptomyces caniscabiei]WEO23670.1 sucrase ferredoxin [Streptomyces caniscabiei]
MSTCTSASRHLDEPLAGTAATARTWLLLEQPGPWGVKALTSSHLDPALGRALEAATEGTGVRVALIRRPGRHADCREVRERQVFVAHTAPGNVWLHSATTSDPRRLLDLDLAALGRGEHHTLGKVLGGRPHTGDPLALVCTNGKRDRCCALLGRPLAAELAASGVEGTWEVTHLGGHRFSPTLLVLPFGYVYGRAEAHHVKEVLQGVREGRVVTEGCRGNSAWERPGQAAELAVRTEYGEDTAGALTIVRTEGAAPRWDVVVAHTDGRHWTVAVAQDTAEPPRQESCGSALGSPTRMAVLAVRELTPHHAS